jgi:membrane peptidoglycan carboxypeptidase
MLLPVLGMIPWVVQQIQDLQESLAQVSELSAQSLPLATEIFDRNGEKIGEFSDERRYFIHLADLPPHVIHAFLSAEDKNFYSHAGVSPLSIVRAGIANLRGGGFRQGASTLTQQLARMYFLSQEKSISRKFKEAVLALEIEKNFSKNQILELYLNAIYLGARSHGIEAAARNYFRKSASALSVPEAALLAAMPKSPAAYSPQKHREKALLRRNWVLGRMEKDGYLKKGVSRKLATSRLSVASKPEDHWSTAPYFVTAVRKDLLKKLELPSMPRYGLKVFTSLDANLQAAAHRNLTHQLALTQGRVARHLMEKDRLEGAQIMLDPHSGEILAMQGGRAFQESQFNRSAETRRPLGTLLTPLLAALALERGYTPMSPVTQEPSVHRSYDQAPTVMDLTQILSEDSMRGTRGVSQLLGYGSVADFLARLHIPRSSLQLSEAADVSATPLQMAQAYASIANGGFEVLPQLISRVEDREGHVLFNASQARKSPVLDPKVAFVTYELMRGTTLASRLAPVLRQVPQAASAHGQSQDGRDLWFVGLLPKVVSVMWLGSEHGRIQLEHSIDFSQQVATDFWSQSAAALRGFKPEEAVEFTPPPGVAYIRRRDAHGAEKTVPIVAGSEASSQSQRF